MYGLKYLKYHPREQYKKYDYHEQVTQNDLQALSISTAEQKCLALLTT